MRLSLGKATQVAIALALPASAAAQSFGPAAPAIEGNYLAGASSSAMDARGDAVVTGSGFGTRRAPGGGWAAPATVATGSATHVLRATAAGAATMVSGGPQGIYVQDMAANGRWGPWGLLAPATAGALVGFVMNARGDAMVVYGTKAVRRAAGSKAWGKPETVALPPAVPRGGVQLQSAAIGGAGDAVVTYETYVTFCGTRSCSNSNYSLYAAREWVAGAGFKPSAVVTPSTVAPRSSGPAGLHLSRVAIDRRGVATVAYADGGAAGGPNLLRTVSQTRAQTSWGAPATLFSHPYGQPFPLAVSVDASGQASVLFYDPQVAGVDVVDGDTRSNAWGAPTTLVTGSPGGPPPQTAVGASGLGGLVLGWTVGDGTVAAVARAKTGAAWTPAQRLAPYDPSCATDCVAINSAAINDAGQAVVTWSFFDPDNELFQFNAAATD